MSLNLAMIAWFATVAFGFGPNIIMFHKLTRLAASDFVPVVEKYCVPDVRAIKIYQKTHGHLPNTPDDMGFQTSGLRTGPGMVTDVQPYTYWAIDLYEHKIIYDFSPGQEGWSVRGAFVNGPLPVPPVTLESAESLKH